MKRKSATDAEDARLNASRQNGAKSRGPKSPAGKARSAKNATRHGLLAAELLMPDEDQRELDGFRSMLLESLSPEGGMEALLAERVVAAAWRLRRSVRIEAQALERSRCQWNTGTDHGIGHAFTALCVNGDVFSKLSRYEAALERALYRALHELQRLQASRAGLAVPLPVAVDVEVAQQTEPVSSGSFGSEGATAAPSLRAPTED